MATQMQVDQPQSQDAAKDDQSTNQGEFLYESYLDTLALSPNHVTVVNGSLTVHCYIYNIIWRVVRFPSINDCVLRESLSRDLPTHRQGSKLLLPVFRALMSLVCIVGFLRSCLELLWLLVP